MDVFFLFWSTAAKDSEWVLKEVRYAIAWHAGDDLAPPEIVPVMIEGPPPVAPPPELKGLHFNDKFLYFIADSALQLKTRGPGHERWWWIRGRYGHVVSRRAGICRARRHMGRAGVKKTTAVTGATIVRPTMNAARACRLIETFTTRC